MPVRIVQVGLGRWGLNWAHSVVSKVPNIEIVGWVDADKNSLLRAQAKLGLRSDRCFASLPNALAQLRVDAVLITANVDAHAPLAEIAIGAGKHVLVEKPFVAALDQARRLVELAERAGCLLMVSQNFRFFPAAMAAAQLVREGKLGFVNSVSVEFRRYVRYERGDEGYLHYNLRQPLLEELSIHHFDLMRMVLGQEPRSIYCCAWNPEGSEFREAPAGAAMISFDGGTIVSYRGNWISAGVETAFGGDWRMECPDGEIAWACRGDRDISLSGERLMIRRRGEEAEYVDLPAMPHFGRAGALAAFAQTIETGAEHPYLSSGRDNINSLALMQAAILSSASGKVVPIPKP